MNSQDFLILNLLGAAAFLFWYLISRGGPMRPNPLNLKNAETQSSGVLQVPKESATVAKTTKTLNVMFNYNGHSWDAYEVLGVPAGSSLRIVTEAYQNQLRRCEKGATDFLEVAYKTILNKDN